MTTLPGAEGAGSGSVRLMYVNSFALVKSIFVMTRSVCTRYVFGVGTDVVFSSITSLNSWWDVYIDGVADVEICSMS